MKQKKRKMHGKWSQQITGPRAHFGHIVLKMKISQQNRSELHKESYAMQALYMTSKLRGQNYIDVPRNVVEGKLREGGKVDSYRKALNVY